MNQCSICNTKTSGPAYIPDNSFNGVQVCLCSHCGHVESFPKRGSLGKGGAVSSALYGGLRVNKHFSTDHAIDVLRRYDFIKSLLDIGASRGDFYRRANAVWNLTRVMLVEPDESLVPDLVAARGSSPFVDIATHRIGDWYPDQNFDLIYMAHTLEHLEDPVTVLKRLSVGCSGVMYVEVPNIDIVGQPMVEEFFIDRHYHHFSKVTLKQALHAGGWRVVDRGATADSLWAVCGPSEPLKPRPTNEAQRLSKLLEGYEKKLYDARVQMANKVQKINNTEGAVVWGAGRIFSQMVLSGLKSKIQVVDSYSSENGAFHPGDITFVPKTVFIASRVHFDQIKTQALERWPGVTVEGVF